MTFETRVVVQRVDRVSACASIRRNWYLFAEQLAPAPHLARPEGRAALTHCAEYCAPCQPLLRDFPDSISTSYVSREVVVQRVDRVSACVLARKKPGPRRTLQQDYA